MHIYKYAKSHSIVLHQYAAVTTVTIILVCCDKNRINTQIILQQFVLTSHTIIF